MKRSGSVLVIGALLAVFAILLAPRVLKVRQLQTRSDALDAELERLRKQNTLLERELMLLREDPVYLEKVAREKFNKAKSGEIVYKVVREGQVQDER
jgi:cell division protein FtsB